MSGTYTLFVCCVSFIRVNWSSDNLRMSTKLRTRFIVTDKAAVFRHCVWFQLFAISLFSWVPSLQGTLLKINVQPQPIQIFGDYCALVFRICALTLFGIFNWRQFVSYDFQNSRKIERWQPCISLISQIRGRTSFCSVSLEKYYSWRFSDWCSNFANQ